VAAYEGNHLASDPVAQLAWRRRQIRIVRAILAGNTLGVVAVREALTSERIRQIVQVACVHALRLTKRTRRSPELVGGIESIRQRRRFWLSRLRALEQVWGIPKETPDGAAGGSGGASAGPSAARSRRPPNTVRKTQHGK
jgi:hypothetical protein